jgi:hypothetical protein
VRRHSIVYGANILDPDTREVRVDYVGQTVQTLAARERQHRGQDPATGNVEQPWSDLIVGALFVIEEGWWTAAELDAREEFHIRRVLPRYNYTHNQDNPDRIPIPEARRQREARDAARGLPSPQWDRPARQTRAPRRAVAGGWPRWRRWAVGLATTWLALSIACWVLACTRFDAPVLGGLEVGTVGASAVMAGGGVGWWRYRQARPRTRRKVWALAAVVVLLGVLWLLLPAMGPRIVGHLPADMPTR